MSSSSKNPHETNDCLHLDDVDRAIRINRLKEEIEKVAGEKVLMGESEDCPPELVEQFLENVLEIERAPAATHLALLERRGLHLPLADELSDVALREKLWELFQVLEKQHTYVYHTNHLSDRELYTHLCQHSLVESTFDLPDCADSFFCIDLLGSGSDEDIHLDMKYYAKEDERARWMEAFPDFPMPPHEDPPYDRDRFLPRRGWPWD